MNIFKNTEYLALTEIVILNVIYIRLGNSVHILITISHCLFDFKTNMSKKMYSYIISKAI